MGRLNDDIEASGTSVLVIGPRGRTAAALAAKHLGVPFPVLADANRETYRSYGFTKSFWVIQQSGVVIVDQEGVARLVHRSTNPQKSWPEATVLQTIKGLSG